MIISSNDGSEEYSSESVALDVYCTNNEINFYDKPFFGTRQRDTIKKRGINAPKYILVYKVPINREFLTSPPYNTDLKMKFRIDKRDFTNQIRDRWGLVAKPVNYNYLMCDLYICHIGIFYDYPTGNSITTIEAKAPSRIYDLKLIYCHQNYGRDTFVRCGTLTQNFMADIAVGYNCDDEYIEEEANKITNNNEKESDMTFTSNNELMCNGINIYSSDPKVVAFLSLEIFIIQVVIHIGEV
uniref:CUB domain-containing protein n=1 Tax=Strongyloides papillosus TaxID=174720 RepID=A0A0N5C071_STREA